MILQFSFTKVENCSLKKVLREISLCTPFSKYVHIYVYNMYFNLIRLNKTFMMIKWNSKEVISRQNKGVLAKTIHEKERLNVLIPLPVFTALSFPDEWQLIYPLTFIVIWAFFICSYLTNNLFDPRGT